MIHLAEFLYEMFTGRAEWQEFGDVFLHIPFILPLRNPYFAFQLLSLSLEEMILIIDPLVKTFRVKWQMTDFQETTLSQAQAVINCIVIS